MTQENASDLSDVKQLPKYNVFREGFFFLRNDILKTVKNKYPCKVYYVQSIISDIVKTSRNITFSKGK